MLLKKLHQHNIIQYGDFTLKSGQRSEIYVDMRKVISIPSLHRDICEQLSKCIDPSIDIICGTPYGAVSYASHVSITNNIPMIFLRKEKKQHGTKRLIEGSYRPKQKVFLIEDVTTTGGSVRESAKILEDHGLEVAQIVTVLSRSENPFMMHKKIPIRPLCHIQTKPVPSKL